MTIEEFNALEKGDLVYSLVCWDGIGIVQVDSVAYVKGKGRRTNGVEVCHGTEWSAGNFFLYSHDIHKWHTAQGLEAAMIAYAEKVLALQIGKCRNRIEASTLKLNDLLHKKPSDIIDLPTIHQKKEIQK